MQNPADPNAFEGVAVVFDGPKDFHARIDDPDNGIDEHSILVMRGVGPVGYPGAPEVVNMRAPAHLIKRGIKTLACIGDGRQSGTSASPSILNCSPEAAVGGNLALLNTGDRIRIDLGKSEANILISEAELAQRRAAFEASGGYPVGASATPWQQIYRETVGQLETGGAMEFAVNYQRVAAAHIPKDSH
jgi:dihydroxy-acid dehydratase